MQVFADFPPWALEGQGGELPVDGRSNTFGDVERLRDSYLLTLGIMAHFSIRSNYCHCYLLLGWAKVPLGDQGLAVLSIASRDERALTHTILSLVEGAANFTS